MELLSERERIEQTWKKDPHYNRWCMVWENWIPLFSHSFSLSMCRIARVVVVSLFLLAYITMIDVHCGSRLFRSLYNRINMGKTVKWTSASINALWWEYDFACQWWSLLARDTRGECLEIKRDDRAIWGRELLLLDISRIILSTGMNHNHFFVVRCVA